MHLYKKVHFIGIGGISMSALAKILISNGVEVSGSDITETPIVTELRSMGSKIAIPHCYECIENPDIIVYTSAIKDDNPEMVAARDKGIELVERATMVGNIMRAYAMPVAVAGTHGKTTTTSMMAYTMIESDLDPTVMVGGELDILGGNLRIGKGAHMVTEACEYCRNFLQFAPKIGMILNIEADHLDYYKDLDDVIDAFSSFSNLLPKDGTLVINGDDANCIKASKSAVCNVITVGIKNGDYKAENITYDKFGYPSFDVVKNGNTIMHLTLNVVGEHNIYNSLCAIAASLAMTDNTNAIKSGLEKFTGTKRRFEKKGEVDGILVVDDYAHHPTEIRATLSAVKKIQSGNVWCVFQPHTYTRTKTLFDDFADALADAQNLIIADIYAAREKDTGLVHARDLAGAIDGAAYISGFENIAEYFMKNAKEGDIILTMGAGDIFKVGELILQKR
ncbi:MAG: UDP-N-acetylmuramate--L-alanine ligase [Clostridia bacterium]|nr:UDP-N-acetylmuramate--L-alanine ligase [Clostridia bacterium]